MSDIFYYSQSLQHFKYFNKIYFYLLFLNIIFNIQIYNNDNSLKWGLGIGDWGLGI